MEWTSTVFELIDPRSFSNLWFWIALAVAWSTASHFVLGVPFDMVTRARRQGGETEQDVLDLVRVNANRINYISDTAGSWLIGIAFFLLAGLFNMGFILGSEFCQAVFLIAFPMSIVFALSIRLARRISGLSFEETVKKIRLQRLAIQFIGMFAILVTSMWGMYYNLTAGVLGG